MMDGDIMVVLMWIYIACSLVWGLCRVAHHWWTGPTGGRFPPDAFVAVICLRGCALVWAAVKARLEGTAAVKAPSAKAAKNPFRKAARQFHRRNSSASEVSRASQSGFPGPAFTQTLISELSQADSCRAVGVTATHVTKLSPILMDNLDSWVEESSSARAVAVIHNHRLSGVVAFKAGLLSSQQAATSTPSAAALSEGEDSFGSADSSVAVNVTVADIELAEKQDLSKLTTELQSLSLLTAGDANLAAPSASEFPVEDHTRGSVPAVSVAEPHPAFSCTVPAVCGNTLAVCKASLAIKVRFFPNIYCNSKIICLACLEFISYLTVQIIIA
jgi:hypothetical protein